MPADRALIADIRGRLASHGDPERASAQQRYMKSTMLYHGVRMPEVRRLSRAVFEAHPLSGFAAWQDTTLQLWRRARYREERYAAIELSGYRLYRQHQVMAAIPMY